MLKIIDRGLWEMCVCLCSLNLSKYIPTLFRPNRKMALNCSSVNDYEPINHLPTILVHYTCLCPGLTLGKRWPMGLYIISAPSSYVLTFHK